MNLGQAKSAVIKLIREYSTGGRIIAGGKNLDYTLSMNTFFDIAQKDIAKYRRISTMFAITQNIIDSAISGGMRLHQHLEDDITYKSTEGAKSYTLEVDKAATIYIEEETSTDVWSTLVTINHSSSNGFTRYKGLLVPSVSTNPVRIRFSGNYVYNYRYFALYNYAVSTEDEIPPYTPYIEYELNKKVYSIKHVDFTHDYKQNHRIGDYKFNKLGDIGYISFKRELEGQFEVNYYKIPDDIPNNDDDPTLYDSTEFEVGEDAQKDMLFLVASMVTLDENAYLSESFKQDYYIKVNSFDSDDSSSTGTVQDVYGWA